MSSVDQDMIHTYHYNEDNDEAIDDADVNDPLNDNN